MVKVTREDIEGYNRIYERSKELILEYLNFGMMNEVEFIDVEVDNVIIENDIVFIEYIYFDKVMHEDCEDVFGISINYFLGEGR